jgi:3-isopropylmalate dehydrogenase
VRARIASLPGDGVGPEVTDAAVAIVRAVAERYGHEFSFDAALIGGAAIDAAGSPLPEETVARCLEADAVLLGAVGGPRWDDARAAVRPEQGLLGIRRALGLFANLRPVRPLPRLAAASPIRAEHLAGVDLMVVRELTGGIYFGEKTCVPRAEGGEVATDLCRYDTGEIERIARMAGDIARARRSRVTSVDKANVLETSRLWRRTVSRVMAEEFPDIALDHMLVDACAMHLIRRPRAFDVIVTENMFGDILTDEASILAGSIGTLPSASLGEARNSLGLPRGLYEPIHGSAPDIAGTNAANPAGAILSAALMLRHSLGLHAEAAAIERAFERTVEDGVLTPDLAPAGAARTTSEVTAAIRAALEPAEMPLRTHQPPGAQPPPVRRGVRP